MCSRDIFHRSMEIILIKSTKISGSQDDQAEEAGPCYGRPRVSKLYSSEVIRLESTGIIVLVMARCDARCSSAVFSLAKTKGNFQARVHSDQMVLVIVRREAGVAMTLKLELKNNHRQPRGLTEKRPKRGDSLK
jgi:hypothetical protein